MRDALGLTNRTSQPREASWLSLVSSATRSPFSEQTLRTPRAPLRECERAAVSAWGGAEMAAADGNTNGGIPDPKSGTPGADSGYVLFEYQSPKGGLAPGPLLNGSIRRGWTSEKTLGTRGESESALHHPRQDPIHKACRRPTGVSRSDRWPLKWHDPNANRMDWTYRHRP